MNRSRSLVRVLAVSASLCVAAAVAATGASAGAATSSEAGSSASTQTLRIALDFYANVDYLGIYVAISKGYFAKEHIKPVIIPYASTPAETLLAANKTDLATTYPPNIPASRASGLKYEAVAGVSEVNTIALAVLASSKFKNVAELSGQLYGGFGTPSDPAIITAIFKNAGVKHPVFNQVTLTTAGLHGSRRERVA